VRAADATAVKAAHTTLLERRALSVVIATASDMQQQADLLKAYGRASGLRGGRYVSHGRHVSLDAVRVVRDATISGRLTPAAKQITGTLTVRGSGVADGRLSVRLTTKGHGTAAGALDGRRVRRELTYG
jgi:hypothetical protein